MALAIFDLDNTLLADDSDYLWGIFLSEQGRVDAQAYRAQNLRYHEAYQAGALDIHAFLRFALRPLVEIPLDELCAMRSRFISERIEPVIAPGAPALIEKHRQAGDTLMIITATNRFVTAPIAALLGIDTLLATEPEMRDGAFTGAALDPPCFQAGKVSVLETWCRTYRRSLKGSYFYSDSHNDLPLLERVGHAVAVDADQPLQNIATQRGWPTLSLRT